MAEFRLTVPEPAKVGFQKLHKLSKRSLNELVGVLSQEQPSLRYSELMARIAVQVKSIKIEDLRDILGAVSGIFGGASDTKKTLAEFVQAISDSSDLALPESEKIKFRNAVNSVLSVKSLEVTTKANEVFIEHEHVFHEARIVTDIRPVFLNDESGNPRATEDAVVIHMLKIEYGQDANTKSFYVALDSRDLVDLRNSVDRAIAKEDICKDSLEKAEIRRLEVN